VTNVIFSLQAHNEIWSTNLYPLYTQHNKVLPNTSTLFSVAGCTIIAQRLRSAFIVVIRREQKAQVISCIKEIFFIIFCLWFLQIKKHLTSFR